MIYVEFIDRDSTIPIEVFRQIGNQQSAWAEGADDRMILQLGRTLRLGPKPSYLCFWEISDLGRLDAWEEYFHSAAAVRNPRSQAMHRAIRIERAGIYDLLCRGPSLEMPLYVVHYCEPALVTDGELSKAYEDCTQMNPDLSPILLLRRFGRAGPDPGLLSIWGARSYVALEPLLRREAPSAWCRSGSLSRLRRGSLVGVAWQFANHLQSGAFLSGT
jgi:hypothetical protein